MFNYIGRIVGIRTKQWNDLDKKELTADYKGAKLYTVYVPALSSTGNVEAGVLTLPGIVVDYKEDDVVVLAELEQRIQDITSYFILGRLSKCNNLEELLNFPATALSADELILSKGSIKQDVMLVASERNGLQTQVYSRSVLDLLRELQDAQTRISSLEAKVDSLKMMEERLKPLELWYNSLHPTT